MNNYSSLVQQLISLKVVPVIVINSVDEALSIGKVLIENNLPIAEITFRTSAAKDGIKVMKQQFPSLLIGAGTILNPTQAQEAKDAGSDFIVSPGFNIETVKACKALDIPIIPGVNNPTAIEMALNEGLTALKFFPAEASGGIKMIQALLAPYRDIVIMPTGGINEKNVKDYLNVDRIIACGLSWMVDPKLIAANDWDEIAHRIQTIHSITES